MQKHAERIARVRFAYGKVAAAAAGVEAAHVPVYCERFGARKTYKTVDDIYRFLAVTVRQLFRFGIVRYFDPLAVFVLDVAHILFIIVYFAHVVQQGAYRDALVRDFFLPFLAVLRFNDRKHAPIYVYAVLAKPAGMAAMEAPARRRGEKVRPEQVFAQLRGALPRDVFIENIEEFVFCVHMHILPYIHIFVKRDRRRDIFESPAYHGGI